MTAIDVSSTLPLSARVISRAGEAAQKNVVPSSTDPSLITPEDVNNAVDRADQRIDQVRDAQSSRREDTRSAIVQLNGQQHQQDQIDLYLSVVTGEEVDQGGSGAIVETDINQTVRRGEVAQSIADSDIQGPRERQQQALLDRIAEAIEDRPSIQSSVDTSA